VLVASSSGQTSCSLTPAQVSSGPLYVPHAPKKKSVCDKVDGLVELKILTDKSKCEGISCWGERNVTQAHRIRVSGTIRDTSCNPIPGAQVDLWQPSPGGRYGAIRPELNEQGFCRSVIFADNSGRYEFETYESGSYGVFSGFLPFYGDIPPWIPRHIHVIAWSKGFKVFLTQLYFDSDPAVDFDFRAGMAKLNLGAEEPALRLQFKQCPNNDNNNDKCATMDFTMDSATTEPEKSFGTLEEASFHQNCVVTPFSPGQPFPLCHPWLIPFVRVEVMFGLLFTAIAFLLWIVKTLVCCIFCRHRSSSHHHHHKKD